MQQNWTKTNEKGTYKLSIICEDELNLRIDLENS